MRRDIPLADLEDFLALPLVAVLGTYRRDGSVLLSPVWHRWSTGGFEVMTGLNNIKVRHLRSDPRASIVVYENAPPYRGVELRTTATLQTIENDDVVRDIASRYLGEEGGEAFAASSDDGILIRLEPGDVRTWDFAGDF